MTAIETENLNLASPKDIAAMKLIAIIQRGTKRDFFDVYFLIKNLGLGEIPPNFKEFATELNSVSVPTRYPDELKTLLKEYKRTRVAGILKKTKEHEVP